MVEWKRLSCAVDLGEPSRISVECAADLAMRLGAELTLVHVHVPLPPGADLLLASRSHARAEEAKAKLERWRGEVEGAVGRPVRATVLSGDAVDEIVRHARDAACDLLIVGAHGRARLPHRVLGSVAERVLRRCPCPVLVVRDGRLAERAEEAEEIAQYV